MPKQHQQLIDRTCDKCGKEVNLGAGCPHCLRHRACGHSFTCPRHARFRKLIGLGKKEEDKQQED